MAILVPVTGVPTIVNPENGTSFTLKEMQTLVGGYVEPIPYTLRENTLIPSRANGDHVIGGYCDEEGRLKGAPINKTASDLFDAMLLGPVVLTYRGEFE